MDFKRQVITFGNKLEAEDMGTDPCLITRKYPKKEPKNLDFLEKTGYNNKA